MKIAEQIVQTQKPYEANCLSQRARSVNMRLFRENEGYKKVIISVIECMKEHLGMVFEDYTNLRGVSGVILGYPWNIIAYKDQSNVIRVCINPQIVKVGQFKTEVAYKCPAITYEKPVMASRYNILDLQFYDLNGHQVTQMGITRQEGGYIIQHEIEHCNGTTFDQKGDDGA